MSPSELVPFPVVFVTFVSGGCSGVVPLAELIGAGGRASALSTRQGFGLI